MWLGVRYRKPQTLEPGRELGGFKAVYKRTKSPLNKQKKLKLGKDYKLTITP